MKLKQNFNILILIFTTSFFTACGGGPGGPGGSDQSGGGVKQASQADVKRALNGVNNPADKKTSILGKKIADTKGDITYGLPRGRDSMVIALTPYQTGFKVFFHSFQKDDPEHVCGGAYVIQKGNIFSFRIADNLTDYVNDNPYRSYKGYVESGVADSCDNYDKDTVWVVSSEFFNGFNPLQPYTVIIDSVGTVDYDDLAKIEVSINDKTDKTVTNKNYLGKKIGNGVTKVDYARNYPSKKFGFEATITPYEKGFRVLATSSDEQMCFSVNSDVYQDGTRYEIDSTASSWYEYFADNAIGQDAYVESGFFSSCEDLPLDTTYVVKASRVGFDPKRPYTVKLGSVDLDPDTGERQAFEIKPSK